MQETIATIERAAGEDKIPFSVFKITGVGRFALLEKVNAKQGLTENEKKEYEGLKTASTPFAKKHIALTHLYLLMRKRVGYRILLMR